MIFIMTTCGRSIAAKLSCAIWTLTALFMRESEDFYRDFTNDVEKRIDASGYSKDNKRPLPIGNK